MDGFFDLTEVEIYTPQVAKRKPVKKERYYDCEQCGLYKNCVNGKMSYEGKGESGILVVLESPTIQADRIGKVVAGEYRHILNDICESAGLSRTDDLWVVNAIQCKHKKEHASTRNACRPRLLSIVDSLKPKAVIAMGQVALDVLLGDKAAIGDIRRFEGYEIPFHGHTTMIYPTFGMKDYIMDRYNPVMMLKMQRTFQKAKYPREYVNYMELMEAHAKVLTKESEISNMLLTMETKPYAAFDFETTGLQPYKPGHKIICMSVSDGKNSYCFMVSKKNIPYIVHFLESDVAKIAHNAKYELTWAKLVLGCEVHNLIADTMLIAHSLNNVQGIVRLKFQSLLEFGIPDYSTSVDGLLEADSVHDFNKLYYMELRGELATIQEELMKYCAIDSLITAWLYERQQEKIGYTPHISKGIELFLETTKAFVDIEIHGMAVNMDRVHANMQDAVQKMADLDSQMKATAEVQQWDGKLPINIGSNDDLGHLLYDLLGYKVYKYTAKDNRSTDAEALDKIIENEGSEFLELLRNYRKLDKIVGTYLKGIENGVIDGRIHPSFNLHRVVTFRTSSSNPNFQNQPKHDKLAKQLIRTVFIPDKGAYLEELDFSALEVNISQCYNQDAQLLLYLMDTDNHNMHTDSACDLFLRTKETMLKEERQLTKGAFVFAQLYGSSYKNCAINLWENMKPESKEHLAKHGYHTLEQYTELVKNAENEFWNVRFKDWGKWIRDNWKKYQLTGYIDTHTGFRLNAIMRETQASNAAIQGSASHCLLYVMTYIHKRIKALELKSKIIGQIHDSIVFNMYPDEAELVHKIAKMALDDLRDNWEWITLQLVMEYDVTPVDGNWAELETAGRIMSK